MEVRFGDGRTLIRRRRRLPLCWRGGVSIERRERERESRMDKFVGVVEAISAEICALLGLGIVVYMRRRR